MSSLFFWIIILSILIPFMMRWYRRSTSGRNQRYFGGPGAPGEFGGPGNGPGAPGQHQHRDGYTQQDYFAGPYRQLQPRQDPAPVIPSWQDTPPFEQPRQEAPNAPEAQAPAGEPPAAPPPPAVPSAPQGYRARKLAELDAKFTAGELAMEDYMAQRDEIMRG